MNEEKDLEKEIENEKTEDAKYKNLIEKNKMFLVLLAVSIAIAIIVQVIIYFHKNLVLGYIIR